MFRLDKKVALITGSSRGIGRSIAHEMAKAGANVVISSRKQDACDRVAEEINQLQLANQGRAIAIPCNISDRNELERLVTQTREQFEKIDILVLNAALNPHFGPLSTIPDKAFDRIIDSNVKSNHWLCQMVLPEMGERKDGNVIIVSSVAAFSGNPVLGTYGISKAADLALIRNLAVEYGGRNVRANAIAPGLIKTDFSRMLWENKSLLDEVTLRTPLQRMGEPEDIAGVAVFLASDAAKYITGQTIIVDGGGAIS